MRQIEIEVNGKKRTVTLEQLQTLVSRRFIKPDATAWVDDEELKVAELINRPSTGEKPNGTGTPIDQTAKPETSELPPLRAETPIFRNVDVPTTKTATTESPKETSSKNLIALAAGIIGLVMVVAIVIVLYYGTHKSNPEITRDSKPPVSKSQVEENEGDDGTVQQGETEFDVSEENNADNEDRRGDEITPSSAEEATSGEESWKLYWEKFDRSWETIPSSYIGNDCPLLFYAISRRFDEINKQLSQGEFETSAEFHSRIEREEKDVVHSLISGNVHFGSAVGFPIVRERFSTGCNTVDTEYSADQKNWVLSVHFRGTGIEVVNEKKVFVPIHLGAETEKYEAVNGFNAKFEITKTTFEEDEVCVEYAEPQDIRGKIETLRMTLNNVPLEFAKKMKGKISGFCVCDVAYKNSYSDTKHVEPKFSSPKEYDFINRYVFVNNLEFWFYDVTTGKVIAKFGLEEALDGRPKNFVDAKTVLDRRDASSSSSGVDEASASSNVEVDATPSQIDGDKSKSTDTGREPIKPDATQHSEMPFESDISKIPADYLGHNLASVVEALSRPSFRIPTTNFSSQSEYRKWLRERADSLSSLPLYGSLTFNSRLAFVMKNVSEADDSCESVFTSYQESTKTMTIRRTFMFSQMNSDALKGNSAVSRPRGPIVRSSHGTMNAYEAMDMGRDFVLTQNLRALNERSESSSDVYFSLCVQDYEAYGLALECSQAKRDPASLCDHWTLTGVSSEDYKRLKDTIRVLCIFQLGVGGSSQSGFYESTSEAFEFPSYAFCTINPEFWLYDGSTGTILAKYTAEEFLSGRRYALGDVAKKGAKGELGEEIAEELEQPTWDDVLSESVDSPESWESKAPTITIPDDAASLEEALSKSKKGDVILVRSSEKPIPLKGKKAARGESSEVTIDHAVAIVGESDSSENVVVEVGSEETLRIDSRDLVAFKGVTFSFRNTPSADDITPLVVVSNDSKAKFKNCVFEGNGAEKSVGIVVEGEFAVTTFWKCNFQQFGDAGLCVQDSANATLEYCQFLSENRYGVSSFSGAAIKVDKCRFDGNVTGFIAEGGGGVVASNSFFSGNRSNWSISSGSKDASDTKEGNVIEK